VAGDPGGTGRVAQSRGGFFSPSPPGAPPPDRSGGSADTRVYSIGVADNTIPQAGGPSPKGMATVAGMQPAFQGVNFVLSLINDHIQKQDVQQISGRSQVDDCRRARSGHEDGHPLLFLYTQVEAPDESIVKPGGCSII
jgi:hypothetical protein